MLGWWERLNCEHTRSENARIRSLGTSWRLITAAWRMISYHSMANQIASTTQFGGLFHGRPEIKRVCIATARLLILIGTSRISLLWSANVSSQLSHNRNDHIIVWRIKSYILPALVNIWSKMGGIAPKPTDFLAYCIFSWTGWLWCDVNTAIPQTLAILLPNYLSYLTRDHRI